MTKALNKIKKKWKGAPHRRTKAQKAFIHRQPPAPFINGVLGEDETVGAADMSLDLEATMDPIDYGADLHPVARPAHAYKDIIASRETQRKAARIKHDAWLRDHGL